MKIKRILASLLCGLLLVGMLPQSLSAEETLQADSSYQLSGDLSCYVNAMGGIDFGAGMLQGITVDVDSSGNAYMTLYLGVSSGNIYTVDYIAFVDSDLCAPGYYDSSGVLHQDATYTKSKNTATDSTGASVHYVDSITFPISTSGLKSAYTLYLYIESNVMGVQFCNGTGTAMSNNPGKLTPYKAVLTVDWGSLTSGPASTTTATSTVTYTRADTLEGTYLISIPQTLAVEDGQQTGIYQVILEEIDLQQYSGLQVTVPESALMSDYGTEITAEIRLSDNVLAEVGVILTGIVSLPDTVSGGSWSGTTVFTVKYIE